MQRAARAAAAARRGIATTRGRAGHEKPGASLLAPSPNPKDGEAGTDAEVTAGEGEGEGDGEAGVADAGCQPGARRDWLAWSSSLGTLEEKVTGAAAWVMMRATSATVARGYACSSGWGDDGRVCESDSRGCEVESPNCRPILQPQPA